MSSLKVHAAVVMMCLLAVAVQAQWAGDRLTNPGQLEAPNPITCLCTDSQVRASIYYNVSFTCLEQLVWGNCPQDFIKNSNIQEVPEGWCQITCGRCDCCKTVAQVATDQNLTSMLAAAKIAGLDAQLASPASMFTLLAPTNDAFDKAISSLGFKSLDAIPANTLKLILLYHIIPPHYGIDAVWTTPFFKVSDGASIPTVIPNAGLSFNESNGNLTVVGDSNNATIVKADIEACKSFINTIDAVLVPPGNAQVADLPVSAGNIAYVPIGPAPTAGQQASTLAESATDASAPGVPTTAVAASG